MGLCASKNSEESSPVNEISSVGATAVPGATGGNLSTSIGIPLVQPADATAAKMAVPVVVPACATQRSPDPPPPPPSPVRPPNKKVFVSVLHTPTKADDSLSDGVAQADNAVLSPHLRSGVRRRTSGEFTLGASHNPFSRHTSKDDHLELPMFQPLLEPLETERSTGEASTPRSFSFKPPAAGLSDIHREQRQPSVAFDRVYMSHSDSGPTDLVGSAGSAGAGGGDLVFASPFPNAAPIGTPMLTSSQRSNKAKSPMSPRDLGFM